MKDGRDRGKEFNCFVDLHFEDFTDALAFPLHFQCFIVETHGVADVTVNFHIRQEAHFQSLHTLSFAGLHIEGEAGGGITASLSFFGLCEEFTDVVPKTDVSGGAGTRSFSDRGLVHFQDAVHGFPAGDALAAFGGRNGLSFFANQGDHVL